MDFNQLQADKEECQKAKVKYETTGALIYSDVIDRQKEFCEKYGFWK